MRPWMPGFSSRILKKLGKITAFLIKGADFLREYPSSLFYGLHEYLKHVIFDVSERFKLINGETAGDGCVDMPIQVV